MKKIYKTFYGETIDLSKVSSISQAGLKIKSKNNLGTPYVYFKVSFVGCKEYIYKRKLHKGEYEIVTKYEKCGHSNFTYMANVDYIKVMFDDKSRYLKKAKKADVNKCIAVQNLQKQVDNFICDWKTYSGAN